MAYPIFALGKYGHPMPSHSHPPCSDSAPAPLAGATPSAPAVRRACFSPAMSVSEMGLQGDLQLRVPDAAEHDCGAHLQRPVAVPRGEYARQALPLSLPPPSTVCPGAGRRTETGCSEQPPRHSFRGCLFSTLPPWAGSMAWAPSLSPSPALTSLVTVLASHPSPCRDAPCVLSTGL